MGILKFGLKLIGSAALGTAGIASGALRQIANAAGADGLADAIGSIQDKSFNTIQDMWTPDENKDEAYYDNQMEKSADRAESSARSAEKLRSEYELQKERKSNQNNNS